MVVARCESADGRPAAKISWVTTANGNATTVSKPGADNTVTVSSEYRMVPTAADNGKDISCVVTHRTQVKPESFPLKLAVQCKATHTHTKVNISVLVTLLTWVIYFNPVISISSSLSFICVTHRRPTGDNRRL